MALENIVVNQRRVRSVVECCLFFGVFRRHHSPLRVHVRLFGTETSKTGLIVHLAGMFHPGSEQHPAALGIEGPVGVIGFAAGAEIARRHCYDCAIRFHQAAQIGAALFSVEFCGSGIIKCSI